ncbi:MAG: hypothetical protein LCH58_03490 [Bacteroidetes bacterium]|uniref:hypothetical protein n=1 Tax=Phnomibacter sp. TaxID=2836217 RepID=UPI002FDE8059|nr:hypothetical protein [Bacteroidota bacterium]
MKLVSGIVVFVLVNAACLHAQPVFFQTGKKNQQHLVQLTPDTAFVYSIGIFYDKAGTGPAVSFTDTLLRHNANHYSGSRFSIMQDANALRLYKNKKESWPLMAVADSTVYTILNEALLLKSYVLLSERINAAFPLQHYSFRNGFAAWDAWPAKAMPHPAFNTLLTSQLQLIYDSTAVMHNRHTKTLHFIQTTAGNISYETFKDSLQSLPKEYRSQSSYFYEAVNVVAKHHPVFVYQLAEDDPQDQSIIFMSVNHDKKLVAALQQVRGHDATRAAFIKDYKAGKRMPYLIVGVYLLLGGLLTVLIVTT